MQENDWNEPDHAELAHELYWNSDRSVNSIADELGLSKGGLYQYILPLPTAGECPRCGAGVGFFNRTARDRNEPTCLALCDNVERFPVGGSGSQPGGWATAPVVEDLFDDDELLDEIAFDLEGGFTGIADLDESDELDEDDRRSGERIRPHPYDERRLPLLDKLRSPLSESEKTVVAGALLAAAVGLLFFRLSRR